MRLSLYSAVAFKNPFGLAHAIDIASTFGYDAIEVRGHSLDAPIREERHLNAVGYDMIGPSTLDRIGQRMLQSRMEEKNLTFSGISCYNSLTLPEGDVADKAMEKFREMFDFAAEMGIPWVRLIGFSETPYEGIGQSRPEAKRLMAKRIQELIEYGRPHDIGILLENGENIIPNRSSETLEIADMVASPKLKIVFDVYNAVFEGLNPLEEMKTLGNRIDVLHVKNARTRAPSEVDYAPKGDKGFQWTLLTDGEIDYRRIMEQARNQGFDGDIVCEYANPYKGMSRDFWNSIPDARDWARNAKEFLRYYFE